MPSDVRPSILVVIAVLLGVSLSGCESLTYGYANNWGGFQARNEMCQSVRTFVRAPLGDDGARRAWFLPFVATEEFVSFYAPMASEPRDEYSIAFYEDKVGQLTHYHFMPEFASIVASCLHTGHGFSRDGRYETDDAFRASIRDSRTNRRIEIAAARDTAGFLVTMPDWDGDVEAELGRMLDFDCED